MTGRWQGGLLDIFESLLVLPVRAATTSLKMARLEDWKQRVEKNQFINQNEREVDHYTVSPPTGRDALDIAAETTTCLELLKTFDDRIRSYQKALGGRKGASWRKIGWSLFKADEVASFRQKISQHKQNITMFLTGLMK